MATNIMINGETTTGKTLVAIALTNKLKNQGKRVAYFKPSGEKSFEHSESGHPVDEDAVLMKKVLDMKEDVECICPIVRTMSSYDELIRIGHDALLEKVRTCYEKIADGMDYVVMEGTRAPWNLLHVGLSSAHFAKELQAHVLCLVNFPDIGSIDEVLLNRDFFNQNGVEEIGVVLNMVPPMLRTTVIDKIQPFLTQCGVHYAGTIYQHKELFSPSIKDILVALDGQMVVGEDKLDVIISEFMVGSMAPENALKWFRRAKDKAVITSGDRSDLCQAALETDTDLLILTGGLGPDFSTVERARELGVAIMTTDKDTYSTGQVVDNIVGTVRAEDTRRIQRVEELVGNAIDLSYLGIK